MLLNRYGLLILVLLVRYADMNVPKIDKLPINVHVNALYDDYGLTTILNNLTQLLIEQTSKESIAKENICANSISYYAMALTKKEDWALQMLDSTAKLQSGILKGNFYNLGSYDQCVSINAVVDTHLTQKIKIVGKHCMAKLTIKVPNSGSELGLFWGVCLPNMCTASDLNSFLNHTVPITFTDLQCHSHNEDPSIEAVDIAVIFILLLMVLSSMYDTYLYYVEERPAHPLLLAFSVISNGSKLFAIRKSEGSDQLDCLSGLRTISMMWIIYCHMYVCLLSVGLKNYTSIMDFYKDNWTMYIRGGTVSVDTFFLMSGIVLVYVYFKSTANKPGFGFNIIQYYFHRYLRLTPSLGALILVHISLIKYFGEGPFWYNIHTYNIDNCKKYWWSTILYIQNYVNRDEICIGQSWYLMVDTQLFVLSPLLLFLLKKWPRIAFSAILLGSLASIASSFAVAWIYELKDFNSLAESPQDIQDYMQLFYMATYSRASPWLIGIAVGYAIYQIRKGHLNFKVHQSINLILWASSLAVLCLCVFYDNSKTKYSQAAMSSYIAFIRPAWAIALSWIVVACVTGYGGLPTPYLAVRGGSIAHLSGPINAFLSIALFQVGARLTYSMYIIHLTVLTVFFFSVKEPIYFSQTRMMYEFWSIFALVFFLSIIWTLAFESPIIILEKSLLRERKAKDRKEDVENTSKYMDNNGYQRDHNPNASTTHHIMIPRIKMKMDP